MITYTDWLLFVPTAVVMIIQKNLRKQHLCALDFLAMFPVSLHPLLLICGIEITLGLGEKCVSHKSTGQESLFFKSKAVGCCKSLEAETLLLLLMSVSPSTCPQAEFSGVNADPKVLTFNTALIWDLLLSSVLSVWEQPGSPGGWRSCLWHWNGSWDIPSEPLTSRAAAAGNSGWALPKAPLLELHWGFLGGLSSLLPPPSSPPSAMPGFWLFPLGREFHQFSFWNVLFWLWNWDSLPLHSSFFPGWMGSLCVPQENNRDHPQ